MGGTGVYCAPVVCQLTPSASPYLASLGGSLLSLRMGDAVRQGDSLAIPDLKCP
jgi:hypothetical protein